MIENWDDNDRKLSWNDRKLNFKWSKNEMITISKPELKMISKSELKTIELWALKMISKSELKMIQNFLLNEGLNVSFWKYSIYWVAKHFKLKLLLVNQNLYLIWKEESLTFSNPVDSKQNRCFDRVQNYLQIFDCIIS